MHTFIHDTEMKTFKCENFANCGSAIAVEKADVHHMSLAIHNEGWRAGYCPECADRTIRVDRIRKQFEREIEEAEALSGGR
jgi:hypothetical protein